MMKTIKNLSVKVTYRAALCDVEVPDNVYDVLSQGGELDDDDCRMSGSERLTVEWLTENIQEQDASSWECEFDVC